MSKSLLRGLTLLALFVLGCAAAPPPPSTAAPALPVATVNAATDTASPPDAAARKGAPSSGEAAALDGDADGAGQGAERAVPGAAARGIGQPAEGLALGGGAPPSRAPAGAAALDAGIIPVTAADPQWGNKDAPVTIVQFGDFECPFCSRAEQTLTELRKNYGPDRLRIVWKNSPLPFHTNARPAAEAAMIVFQHNGNDAFWAAHDAFFADQKNLVQLSDQVLQRAGIDAAELARLRASGKAAAKVDVDIDTARAAGATGTPAFFINGILLSGAQPIDRFTAIIDEQTQKARAAIAGGTPPGQVYAKLSKEQKAAPPPPVVNTPPPPEDTSIYRVPVGSSPVRGKASAPVTLVEFADYQCPFCGRVEGTIQKLSAEYGDKLRVVWKNNPLPFHPRAEPAAELALEARAQKGDAAFFMVHDALFASQTHLDDADLLTVATAAGLDAPRAMAAVAAHKHKALIDGDLALSDQVKAMGTPHFFINGRRLVGAQPIEKFRAVIDEEMAKAEALIKAGTPAAKVYDKIMSKAVAPDKKPAAAPAHTR